LVLGIVTWVVAVANDLCPHLLVAHVVFAQQAEMWAGVARGGVVPLADQGETQPDQDG
jgi:hypothetical protein